MKLLIFCTILIASYIQAQQFVPPEALVEPLKPAGIRISIPDEQGITLVAYHIRVNEEFYGLEAGSIAVDIIKPKKGRWIYQDRSLKLKENDVIYYWVHVVYNGLGYNLLDQEHVVTCFYNLNGSPADGCRTNQGAHNNDCVNSITKLYDSATVTRHPCAGELLLEENFKNQEQVENRKWTIVEKFPGSPDFEFNIYKNSRDIVNFENGMKITPRLLKDVYGDNFVRGGNLTLTKCTGKWNTNECSQSARGWNVLPPVSSGRINTKNFLNFEYGRVEVRAKFPKGDWLYPLLMLESSEFPGNLPLTQIRIASASGNTDLKTFDGTDISGHVLWSGMVRADSDEFRNRAVKYNSELWANDFHNYELVWNPDRMTFKVDGIIYSDREIKLAGAPVYLTLGLAAGGLLEFPDFSISQDYAKTWRNVEAKAMYNFFLSTDSWHKTWKNNDDTTLKVEYVKFWAL